MLGKKIRELRKEKGITQRQLAEHLNVTVQAVSLWEKDKTDPDLANIKLLAKFFNVTTDELLEVDSYDYTFEYQHKDTRIIHKEKNKKD